jgi:hypothetical protein
MTSRAVLRVFDITFPIVITEEAMLFRHKEEEECKSI